MIFDVTVNQRDYRVELEAQEDRRWACRVNGEAMVVDAASTAAGVLSLIAGGQSFEVIAGANHDYVDINGVRYGVEVRDPRAWLSHKGRGGGAEGPKKILAPMPGKVVRVIVQPGTEVEQGAGVIVIEAMKMQNELKSPKKGRVSKILASEGAAVNAGDVLAIVD